MKAILDRKKSAAAVVAASRRWSTATAGSLAEVMRPFLAEGETLPDLELAQRLLGRALEHHWRRLESADQARTRAAERACRLAGERAAARTALYRRVVDLRRILRGVFGDNACRRQLGIAGDTSRDLVLLPRQARHAVERLADLSRHGPLPPASFEPTPHDLARWAAPVEATAETLRSAAARAARAARELEAAEAEQRRAIAGFDSMLLRVASLLAGVYVGAGRDQRAAAVRPSRRRLGRLLGDDDRATVPQTATPDTAPASAALDSPAVSRSRARAAVSGSAWRSESAVYMRQEADAPTPRLPNVESA